MVPSDIFAPACATVVEGEELESQTAEKPLEPDVLVTLTVTIIANPEVLL